VQRHQKVESEARVWATRGYWRPGWNGGF